MPPSPVSRHDPPAAGGPWQARLLGGIELQRLRHEPLRQFGGRVAEALFGLLALQPGRARSREEIIECLWPGASPEVGRNRLRNGLAGLRKALQSVQAEGLIVAAGDTLAFDAAALRSDVQALDHWARHGGAPPPLDDGDLLPGHYAEWVQDERQRLQALLERLAEQAPARHAAALTPQPRPLPAPISRFFGREAEIARLHALLAEHRLVTMCGHGGGGKTRLALEAARRLAAPQAPLVAWVPLADCHDARQIPEQVLAALQAPATQVVMQAAAGQAVIEAVLAATAGQPLLLVLDNLEQFPPAELAALLQALLAGAPALRVLATSRRPVDLAGEQVMAVAPLPVDVHEPLASPAVQLFLDRARGVQPHWPANAATLREVAQLCQVLDGTPLALELAAARLRSHTPAELLEALDQGPSVLQRPRSAGAASPRHESIEATLRWSVDLLDPADARRFAELSVFAGGFDLSAAQAVCAAPVNELRDSLERLVLHSLLQRHDTAAGRSRFGLLRLVGDFARQRLAEGERSDLRRRHRAWYADLARRTPRAQADALAPDDANLRQAIATALADGQGGDAVALGLALAPYFERHGIAPATLEDLCEAVEDTRPDDPGAQALMVVLAELLINGAGRPEMAAHWADQALARAHDAHSRALALYMKARIAWARTLSPQDMRPWLDEALALARACGSPEAEARALWILGPVLRRQDKDPAAAEACYRLAAERFAACGDPIMANRMLYLQANCALELGEGERSLALHRACADVCERLGDRIGRMRQSNEEGVALLELGRHAEAAAVLGETIRLAWAHHHLYLLVFGLFNLPQASVRLARVADACRLMGFAAQRWVQHVGPMNPAIAAEADGVYAAAASLIGRDAVQACAAEGASWTLPRAVALALDLATPADAALAPVYASA